MSDILLQFLPQFPAIVTTYWIVPGGMIALYFYGRFHFNTPDYLLDIGSSDYQTKVDQIAHLITPTPPIYTAPRSRYNYYAGIYVLILEFMFLLFTIAPSLLWDLLSDASRILTNFDVSGVLRLIP